MALDTHNFGGGPGSGPGSGTLQATFLTQLGAAHAGTARFSPPQAARAAEVAGLLARFIAQAKFSLHVAIYDFRLSGEAARLVVDALNERAAAGVTVRIAYFQAPGQPTPEAFALLGSDPAVLGASPDTGTHKLHPNVHMKAILPDPSLPALQAPIEGEPITAPKQPHAQQVRRP